MHVIADIGRGIHPQAVVVADQTFAERDVLAVISILLIESGIGAGAVAYSYPRIHCKAAKAGQRRHPFLPRVVQHFFA